MSHKRVKLLQPTLLGGSQVPRPVGFVGTVTEGEANALITVGYAKETKDAETTDGATQIEGYAHILPSGLKAGVADTAGKVHVEPAGDEDRDAVDAAHKAAAGKKGK